MNRKSRFFLLLLLAGLTTRFAVAQEGVSYENPNSVSPIPYYEQLYKQRIWSRVDLEQKQNRGFFFKGKEITKLLIDAVMNDEIQTVYDAEAGLGELEKPMTKEEFVKRLQKTQGDEGEPEPQPLYEEDWPYAVGEVVEYNGVNYESLKDDNLGNYPDTAPEYWQVWEGEKPEPFLPSEITILEVMEDVIFDKRRAREYRDIQSIKLVVPGKYTNDGSNYYVATFAYKDLEKFFREHPEKALWYNQYNSAENRNLADAFLLHLYQGQLYKVENPENLTLQDIYGQDANGNPSIKAGLIGAEQVRMKMLEREHNLWSY